MTITGRATASLLRSHEAMAKEVNGLRLDLDRYRAFVATIREQLGEIMKGSIPAWQEVAAALDELDGVR